MPDKSKIGAVETGREVMENWAKQSVVPYDEALLERSRSQWLFGDWESLAALDRGAIELHPDRAKLVLFAAAGLLQTGRNTAAKQFIRLALDWGASKKLVSQILISGVLNSFGRAYLARGKDEQAINYFENAIRLLQPQVEKRLYGESRAVRQAVQLGLQQQAVRWIGEQLIDVKTNPEIGLARIKILETEIELLRHELSLAQQRNQLFPHKAPGDIEATIGSEAWKILLQKKSVSQLGQDIWVLEKTGYKNNGFFVEFGATDGVLLSNTWLLEQEFGWQGLCAEPNPVMFKQLQGNRKCKLANVCIGEVTGEEVEFIFADAYGGMARHAHEDMHHDKRQAYLTDNRTAILTTISLHDFLLEQGAPRDIDYLSIDTEGSEYEILKNFPFEQWNISLLTVEHNYTAKRQDIRQLLERHGYVCQEAKFDDWFAKGNT